MSTFLRLLSESEKAEALMTSCNQLRHGRSDLRTFEVSPESFDAVPGKPFAYWVTDAVRDVFKQFSACESGGRACRVGLQTSDDFRFVRCWWESCGPAWHCFSKGGSYSSFYADIHLLVNWALDGKELRNFCDPRTQKTKSVLRNTAYFGRPGLTWPIKNRFTFKPRVLPAGSIFAHVGPSVFVKDDDADELFALQAIMSAQVFTVLVQLMAGWNFEVGVIQKAPIPTLSAESKKQLANLARRAWLLKRTADSVNEVSHAFVLPAALRAPRFSDQSLYFKVEIDEIHAAIDAIALDLYGFAEADRVAVNGPVMADEEVQAEEDDEEEVEAEVASTDGLLSWAIGVAFGRFDFRIATGERPLPPEPEPFDPLPTKTPGMLPDGTEPFHAHEAILVDEQGHPHDLVHLVEEVLGRLNTPVPDNVRRWLRKEFFAFHLKLYSKSRRKAPIYWPLATATGSYTLWIYYPSLSSQTLYTAINDFLEPKLKHIGGVVAVLRGQGGARSRNDEKQFEALQAFELELVELRDTLLKLAPTYKPNQNDGVQVSAAPLWTLFRHKPWQKVLQDTWVKLEKGSYDWAHLAMNYWPERVREKCKADKSLAIAHGLEALFVEPMGTTES